MISWLVLKYLNGKSFVIWRGYETTLLASTEFNLTVPADVKAGEWVAVHGTGGIGLSVLLLAKMLGAQDVVVDIVEEKLEHARQHGADATVNAAKVDVATAIRDITGGGAQVSIEALGIEATTNASVKCLAILGRHVQVGMPSGSGQMQVNMRAIYSK